MLKLDRLSLVKQGKSILQKISLELPLHQLTLLLGKSGSGKTSLLRCIVQLEQAYQGTITYYNRDIRTILLKDRAGIFGFLSQSYSLFPHLTVRHNC